MKLKSHIRIANNTLESIQSQVDWKINRKAYILGSIAPDLNVAIPTHNIKSTIKRFKKKLRRIESNKPGIIQSFTLGVVMHYICDYFCFAHNTKIVPGHAIYEVYLQKHIMKQEKLLFGKENEVNKQWEEVYSHLSESVSNKSEEEIMNEFTNSSIDHIDKLVDIVIKMNELYTEKTRLEIDSEWTSGSWRVEIDTLFATLICEKVALEIFSVVGDYTE